MTVSPVSCPACHAPLPPEMLNQPDLVTCPACAERVRVDVFPALFRGPEIGRAAENVGLEGESSCYFHPSKKAVVPCDGCGRFLCALCDLDFNGRHVCPTCLNTAQKKGRVVNLQNTRTLHDSVALTLAVLPLLIFYFTLITAPLALFWAIRSWKLPSSILPRRRRVRLVAAMVLASLQIVGWVVAIVAIIASSLGRS